MFSFFLDLMPLVPLIGYLFPCSCHIVVETFLGGDLKYQLEVFRRVRRGRRALKNKMDVLNKDETTEVTETTETIRCKKSKYCLEA
jgi:hypothetical protein